MYLLLLVFGAVLGAAGVMLAASGLSLRDHAFDASIVTPGIVAAVGGLLLIGLGLALRVLQRIEQALAARLDETTEPAAAAERAAHLSRGRLPSKVAAQAQSAPSVASTAAAGEKRDVGLPGKIPAAAGLHSSQVQEETELSPSLTSPAPLAPASVDESVAEADKSRLARRRSGPVPTRISPRLDIGTRPGTRSERPAGPAFDTLWAKGPRPTRAAQSAAAPVITAPVVEPEQKSEPVPDTAQTAVPDQPSAQVSVLKSGVVDGMAYTLYSDGSIEAQLPQGTLRFGSITELRNHIEQSA